MDTPSDRLTIYAELADHYDRLGQVSMRDRFLMLAADAALAAGRADEAERLRQRLLAGSRHHMLRPYGSYAEAARAADVQTYLADLKANYPPDQARDLLDTLREGGAPAPLAPRAVIPPTAPLLDINARQKPRLDDPPIYPIRHDNPPAAQPARPRAQPAPARPAPQEPQPPIRPARAAEPVRPDARPRAGGWFNVTLSALAVLAALALAAFALARPFLPSGWLP